MAKTLRQTVADAVKFLMWNNGRMTVTATAKQAGISRGQLNNILTQNTDTKIDTIESIAKVFNTEPWMILAYRGRGETEIESLGGMAKRSSDIEAGLEILEEVFTLSDDEARLALIRMATALMGWSPDLEGIKLPRDWREVAFHYAYDAGWVELEPEKWGNLAGIHSA